MAGHLIDILGFLAGAMTVTAFYCRGMLCLRCAAICANILFIAYGYAMQLIPVLTLHCVLLPLNVQRLLAEIARQRRRRSGATAAGSAPSLLTTLRGPQRD